MAELKQGHLKIGDVVPNFDCDSNMGPLNFHKYLDNSWGILFSHPADFTPVCTTELGAVQKLIPEFEKRGVKVCALSVDDVESHKKWIDDINTTQSVDVKYPIFADKDRKVSIAYGMLDVNNTSTGLPLTVRSVFIIDPNKKVRLILTYPASCGRNFDEILRCVDSLQLTDKKKVATPANWKNGEDVIIALNVTNEEADKLFPGYTALRPYLRVTKQPQV